MMLWTLLKLLGKSQDVIIHRKSSSHIFSIYVFVSVYFISRSAMLGTKYSSHTKICHVSTVL